MADLCGRALEMVMVMGAAGIIPVATATTVSVEVEIYKIATSPENQRLTGKGSPFSFAGRTLHFEEWS